MTDIHDSAIPEEATAQVPRKFQRSMNGKFVAGVARGLGNRFDIDANIFRVIFVVLACFWGAGVAIYLALWVFVPRAEGEESETSARDRPPVSTSRRMSVVLLAGSAIALALVVLLIIGRGGGHLPPSLALVWLAFLVALAITALRTSARRLTLRRFFAVVFLSGLCFVILAIGGIVAFVDSTGVTLSGGNGIHAWQPTALNQVSHRYATEFGTGTVDLSSVVFPTSGFVIDASTAVGTLRVVLPRDVVVSLTTHVGVGAVYFVRGSGYTSGFIASPVSNLSAAQLRRAPHLVLDARVGIGQIRIVRAS